MTNFKHYNLSVSIPLPEVWNLKAIQVLLFSLLALLCSINSSAQEIKATIDTNAIKIGEQVTYSILVETDSTNLVVFPEGQTFMPLEVVESSTVDTSATNNKIRLLKEYALTQFDSGSYTIPQQQVLINDSKFLTDSFSLQVNNVVVDTTKQKLFPIKPSIEVPQKTTFPDWGWSLIIALLVLALLIYLFLRRKKKKEAAAKSLPPYEQAIFELQQLDNSHLLEDRELKEYYSQLSLAVRKYLDGEIYDHALESTSGELLEYLRIRKNEGKLNIEESTIEKLREILIRADLAKFANSKPDVLTAKEDRKGAELIINDTKAGIPEPTEEELQKDLEYRKKQEKKKKYRKIALGSVLVLVLLGGFVTYMVSIKGFAYLNDTIFGNKSKELLEGEWIRSEYGNPPVAITTPEVLVRQIDTMALEKLPAGEEVFKSGKLFGNFYVELRTTSAAGASEPDQAIEKATAQLENKGAKNIIMKREEFTTINGASGLKVFGTFNITNPFTNSPVNKKYAILNFFENKGLQQILVVYNTEDNYAEEISQRILNSVELRKPEN